jgi:glycine/D-amino acid oxidase-like deaminating enzyme
LLRGSQLGAEIILPEESYLIIGGGLVGLATALKLQELRPGDWDTRDASESTNLAGANPDLVADLRGRLLAWFRSLSPPLDCV